MNAVIIEDEKLAAQKLESMLSKIQPNLKIIKVMGSIEDAVDFFQNESKVDLVFMDIHLSDGSSFNIFDKIEIKARKLQDINIKKQRLLIELEQLKNG